MTTPAQHYSPLISVADLSSHLQQPYWLLVDCRFDLADTGWGERAYQSGHIPGALYAHLDRELSDHSRVGMGRHPFPSDESFSRLLSGWGFRSDSQVVCYDAANGAHAARLWWMLRAIGHQAVAVLDGGFAAWVAAGGSSATMPRSPVASVANVHFDPRYFVDYAEVETLPSERVITLVDARAGERYRGEVEPIDPVAGHVPGALNRPFSENLEADGKFKSSQKLRDEFTALIQSRPPSTVAHMCGSGVTACHNLLAMHHAGLPGARLFAPSWSGWISDPSRPVSLGAA